MSRRGVLIVLVLLGGGVAYGALAPDVIDPTDPWDPPPAPRWEGVLAENTLLARARPVARGQIVGPESLTFDREGRLVTGTADGRIVRIDVNTDKVETLTHTGTRTPQCGQEIAEVTCGRPLGVKVLEDGSMLVADAYRGLLAVSPTGGVRVLTSGAGGVRFGFTDDLDVAKDGRVYFTDASTKFDRVRYREEIVENVAHGRLLRFDPATGTTETLLDHLYFANGVQLAPDESFVLVAETSRYRIQRYWLTGPKVGTAEVFADELPGPPDNLRRASDGGWWIALGAKRSALIDFLHPHPTLARVVARMIPLAAVQKAFVPPVGLVAKLDANGKLVKLLWDPKGESVSAISEVDERDGKLYIGSIKNDRVGVLDLSAL